MSRVEAPSVGCNRQCAAQDTAHGTANPASEIYGDILRLSSQTAFCRLYRYVEFRMLSFAMNNRNPVESFCCLSCRVLKGFLRANCRCLWLLPLLLVWGHLCCAAQQPAAKPPTPRIDEKVLAEISGRGRIVDVYVSRQGEMVWIEEYPDHTQVVLLNGKLMGAYYNEVKYVGESPDGKLWGVQRAGKSRWVMGDQRAGAHRGIR